MFWLWNYKWILIFPCNRFRKWPVGYLVTFPQVVKKSSDGSGHQTQSVPQSQSKHSNCWMQVCYEIHQSYIYLNTFQFMKLDVYQHLSGSSMCPVVWFREEFKIKCPDRQISSGPCLLRPLTTAHLFTTEQKHSNWGLCRGASLSWPCGFSQFSKKQKDLDYSAKQLNNWSLPSSKW